MSRFEDCVKATVEAGKVSRDHARQVLKDFQNAKARGLDDVAAAAEASAADLLRAEAGKATTAQQIIKQTAALENAGGHKRGARAGARAVMADDPWGMAGYESAAGAGRAMQGWMEGKFRVGIAFLKSKTMGLTSDNISSRAFVREIYKETTGDAAAANAAKAWADTDEFGIVMRQAEGSNVKPLEKYLPQPANPAKIERMGRDAYIAARMQHIEDGRIELPDFDTGLPIRDRKRQLEIVEESWESITTGGLNKIEPGKGGRGHKLANAHEERRVFHYTTADAWIDGAETFGYGASSIFEGLMGHIKGVSREFGLLRVMGPNPDSTARALIDQAEKEGKGMLGGIVGTRHHLESVYDQVTGRAQSPVNEIAARAGRTVAAGLRSAQLGSATLSAVGDAATTLKTADFLGLSKTKVISRYLELMNPSSTGGRDQALRTGLGAEHASAVARQSFQDGLEFGLAATASKFSDVVMKVSLLQPHTAAARQAIGSEFLSHLTQLAKQRREFDNLPGLIQRAFKRFGIDEGDWNLIRAVGVNDTAGVDWISPEALMRAGEGEGKSAAIKLWSGINREMDMAAPIGGAFERALIQGKSRPGGIAFEFLVRPFATYKMYPVSVITHHGFRMAATVLEEGWGAGAAYASLAVTMTALGALALQAKSIAQGKDPRAMNDWRFWAHSFIQGGGAGILGDFLNAGTARTGQNYMTTLMGPQWGLINDVVRLTGVNLAELSLDKDTHVGRELANLARRYTPGTSLWYSRLALDRLLWDSVQKELDPDYAQAFRRTEQRARKEFGQEHWWAPGRTEPSRGPNLGAVTR